LIKAPTPALPPRYYRDNFIFLCDAVDQQYADLLSLYEKNWLTSFRHQLSERAQCLYIRLVSRVGPCFRVAKLSYPEIGELKEPLAELLQANLLEAVAQLETEELGRLFTRTEVLTAAPTMPAKSRVLKKPELMAAIADLATSNEQLLTELCGHFHDSIVRPQGLECVDLFKLLFFGNRSQDLTEFVLSDLGVQRYYPYMLTTSRRLFSDRSAVEEYQRLGQLRDQWFERQDQEDSVGLAEVATEVRDFTPVYAPSRKRWYKTCNQLGRDMERRDELPLALQLYALSQLHPARERSARVYENSGDPNSALKLCEAIVEQPWCEAELEAAGRILPRLQRKLGQKPQARSRDQFCEIELQLPCRSVSVELDTAAVLAQQWRSVHYTENTLMTALFGLAFWPQIFSSVEGAFNHPFQRGPADMFQQDFVETRHSQLQSRWQQLRGGSLGEILLDSYDRNSGFQNYWINWASLERDLVVRAVATIPAQHLLVIWQRLLFDPTENRKGFPDLVAFGQSRGDYCMIEVKGPGDALQDSQKRWLRFFQQHEIPARVAWVTWPDD
jgi:hypothetical protein